MTDRHAPARLGLGVDPDPLFADLIAAVGAAAEELGLAWRGVRTVGDTADVDRLLMVGRPGRYRDLISDMAVPARTVWVGEPLPRVAAVGGAPTSGSGAVRFVRPLGRVGRRVPLPGPLDRRRVGVATDRLLAANLREVTEAAAAGASVVVTSRDRAATLAAVGLDVPAVPFGYHPRHAGPLTPALAGDRDVPFLLLGTRGTHTRRASQVSDLVRDPAMAGLRVVEGVWGDERAALLRRTRIVVDVHRVPGNFVGMRLLLAIAAGAVVVTEPMTDPFPFIPGVHHLEAPLGELPGVAAAIATDDARRAAIVEAGQALLAGDLAMRVSLSRVLAAGRLA